MVRVYFNSSSTLCNKQNSCLGNISTSSPILWSTFRWCNLKLTDFYCILLMIVCLYTHTLTQTHSQVYLESINFKIKFVFTTSFFLTISPVLHQSSLLQEYHSCFLYSCRYFYTVNATTFTSMVHMILLCFCKALIHNE